MGELIEDRRQREMFDAQRQREPAPLVKCENCAGTGRRTNPATWRVGDCPQCAGLGKVVAK